MPRNHVDIIDKSGGKAHVWLNDLAEELGTVDTHDAYRALRAFLHPLRDHLPVHEAAQLSAQLPIFVRGVFYEGGHVSAGEAGSGLQVLPEHLRESLRGLARPPIASGRPADALSAHS
jgi:uncharacterized protein (DUF2267 family)